MSLVTDNVDNVGWRASTPQLSLHRAKAVRADLQSNVGAIRVQTRGQAHLEP
jgi:outer membrane protein OmpA-like peptidoglycan-associated protein